MKNKLSIGVLLGLGLLTFSANGDVVNAQEGMMSITEDPSRNAVTLVMSDNDLSVIQNAKDCNTLISKGAYNIHKDALLEYTGIEYKTIKDRLDKDGNGVICDVKGVGVVNEIKVGMISTPEETNRIDIESGNVGEDPFGDGGLGGEATEEVPTLENGSNQQAYGDNEVVDNKEYNKDVELYNKLEKEEQLKRQKLEQLNKQSHLNTKNNDNDKNKINTTTQVNGGGSVNTVDNNNTSNKGIIVKLNGVEDKSIHLNVDPSDYWINRLKSEDNCDVLISEGIKDVWFTGGVNASIYDELKKRDRDGDGVMCESKDGVYTVIDNRQSSPKQYNDLPDTGLEKIKHNPNYTDYGILGLLGGFSVLGLLRRK